VNLKLPIQKIKKKKTQKNKQKAPECARMEFLEDLCQQLEIKCMTLLLGFV
jgi:hypothetical protein